MVLGETTLIDQHGAKRTLHIVSDCGAEGFSAMLRLFAGGQVRGTFQSDVPAHDLHNSVRQSLIDAGLYLVSLESALVGNFSHGPWHSDGNFTDLQESAQNFFANEDQNGELCTLMRPLVARDLNIQRCQFESDEEFHLQVWQAMNNHKYLFAKGDHCKLSR